MSFSRFRARDYRLALVALACTYLSGGCGDGEARLVPVSGKVTINGKPLGSGSVMFMPNKSKGNVFPGQPLGELNEQGEFTIKTQGKPGVPVGAYKVTVASSGPVTADNTKVSTKALVNVTYLHYDTTPLEVEVVANPSPGAYDLKLTP